MSDHRAKSATGSKASSGTRRLKRSDIMAEQIREKIVTAGLKPGDRVPSDWVMPETLGISRGTFREALKVLEFQGMITSKTGPGGGIFVSSVCERDAIAMLDNLFLFRPPSISDIYALRKVLEPEIAAGLAGRLSEEAIASLHDTIRLYEDEPRTAQDEYRQRLAELAFHARLASLAPNRLLGFVCSFLLSLLRDKTECRAIYAEPSPSWQRDAGIHYQVRLIRALKASDADQARQIMSEHMRQAEAFMLQRAVMVAEARQA